MGRSSWTSASDILEEAMLYSEVGDLAALLPIALELDIMSLFLLLLLLLLLVLMLLLAGEATGLTSSRRIPLLS